MNNAIITSPVELTPAELRAIRSALKLDANDKLDVIVDISVIGGLCVSVNGNTVDLTIKRQLAEIAREN